MGKLEPYYGDGSRQKTESILERKVDKIGIFIIVVDEMKGTHDEINMYTQHSVTL